MTVLIKVLMNDIMVLMNNRTLKDLMELKQMLISVPFTDRKFIDRVYKLICDPNIDPTTGKQIASIEYGGAVMNTTDDINIHHESKQFVGEEHAVLIDIGAEFYSWYWHIHPWFEQVGNERYSRVHSPPSGADILNTSDRSFERGYYIPSIVFSKHYAYQIISTSKIHDHNYSKQLLSSVVLSHLDYRSGPYTYYDQHWNIVAQEPDKKTFKDAFNELVHTLNTEYGTDIIMIPNWTNGFNILFPEYRNVSLRKSPIKSKHGLLPADLVMYLLNQSDIEKEKVVYVYSILSTNQYRFIQRVLPIYFYQTENDCNNELIIIMDPTRTDPSQEDLDHITKHYSRCKKQSKDQFLIITPTYIYDFRNRTKKDQQSIQTDQHHVFPMTDYVMHMYPKEDFFGGLMRILQV